MNFSKNDFGITEHVTGCTQTEWNRMKYFVNSDDQDVLVFENGDRLTSVFAKPAQFAGNYLQDSLGRLMQYSRNITFLRYWASGLYWNQSFTYNSDVVGALPEYMYGTPNFRDDNHEFVYEQAKQICVEPEVYYVALRVRRLWDYEWEYPENEGDERGELIKQNTWRAIMRFKNIYHNGNAFNFGDELNHVVTRYAPEELKRQFAIECGDGKWDDDDEKTYFIKTSVNPKTVFDAIMDAAKQSGFYESVSEFGDWILELVSNANIPTRDLVSDGWAYKLTHKILDAISTVTSFYNFVNNYSGLNQE